MSILKYCINKLFFAGLSAVRYFIIELFFADSPNIQDDCQWDTVTVLSRGRRLPVFTGPSGKDDAGLRNFIKRLKERDFSGAIILEQWPDPPSLLNQARDKLQSMFKAEGHWS